MMSALLANYQKEQSIFQELLEDDNFQRILMFYGQETGLGKTTLYDACLKIVSSHTQYVYVPVELQADKKVSDIFLRIGRRIGWLHLPSFTEQVADYLEVRAMATDRRWQNAMPQNLENVLALKNITTLRSRQAFLTNALFNDLDNIDNSFLLAFDTYEEASTEVEYWIVQQLLPWVADANYLRVLLTGQQVPKPNANWETCCIRRHLQGIFDPEAWKPVAEELEKDIPDLEWFGRACRKFRGNPDAIRQFLELFPEKDLQMTDRILIVTVTAVEARSVLTVFSEAIGEGWTRQRVRNKTYYDLGVHGGVPVLMVQSEMGIGAPGGALLTVHQAIRDLQPQAIIMCGIAFGLHREKQQLNDILISRQLQYYEPVKIDLQRGLIPRGDRVMAAERLLDRFRSGDIDWQGAPTHFGLVLSGEKLVNDPVFLERLLKTEPEAIGGEMEGAGLYTAARDNKVDWILVKAICDWGDGQKNDDVQAQAASNAAQFVLYVLQLGGWDT